MRMTQAWRRSRHTLALAAALAALCAWSAQAKRLQGAWGEAREGSIGSVDGGVSDFFVFETGRRGFGGYAGNYDLRWSDGEFLSPRGILDLGETEPGLEIGKLGDRAAAVEDHFYILRSRKGDYYKVKVTAADPRAVTFTYSRLVPEPGAAAPPTPEPPGARAPGAQAESAAARADVDEPPAAPAGVDPSAFAVVIGIEKYRQKGIPPVEFAARDARAMHGYLTRAMGFAPRNVTLLENEHATKTDLEKFLGTWLKNRVKLDGRVFVYFAGHGAPNPKTGEGYLVPYEGDASYTEDTAYPLKRLFETLSSLPAKEVTVVLDACFSGQGSRSIIAKGARPLVTKTDPATAAGRNAVVLTATGSDQISTHHPDSQHGLLTYFLLKGLRGEADSDHDGRVTTRELFGFVQPAVEDAAKLQNVEQSPTLAPPPEALGPSGGPVWIRLK